MELGVVMSGLTLFLAALLHEDVAIVIAAVFVARDEISLPAALAIVYGGVLINNLTIYALGKAARHLPLARRWLIGPRVEQVRRKLERHFVPAVLFCRTTFGLMYVTFLACGWFRLAFAKFALLAAVAAGVYVSAMLMLVVTFGEVALQRLREWGWVAVALLVGVVLVMAVRAHVRTDRPQIVRTAASYRNRARSRSSRRGTAGAERSRTAGRTPPR